MRIDILTIFPGFFTGFLETGILRRALSTRALEIHTHDLRDYTHDRHRTVDDRPFGGGEGMLLKPQPIFDCIASLGIAPKPHRDTTRESVILLSPQGRVFTQPLAHTLAATGRIALICGRYEGVDERVNTLLCDRELSIGDFVLTGGELAAAVIADTIVRLLPGVLGNPDSFLHESFGAPDSQPPALDDGVPRATHGAGGLLDYPQYTRPADFNGTTVPAVLIDGNHDLIRQWRRRAALEKTLRNRPDLLDKVTLGRADRKILDELRECLENRASSPHPDET
jgi:tRNA (guanine37-N1)-methyltransferase